MVEVARCFHAPPNNSSARTIAEYSACKRFDVTVGADSVAPPPALPE